MIEVIFCCGHAAVLTGGEVQPACPKCGERTISRVDAPAPVFRGHVRGPCAVYADLPATPVSFGEK